MNYLNLWNAERIEPAKGKLLIAEPFLHDPNFARSVVFLCEHGPEGTIGFVLNQLTSLSIGDLVIQLENHPPLLGLYNGGPVQPDTLHIMHRIPDVLGGVAVAPGIYWGGSYEILQHIIQNEKHDEKDIRLFIGYSGWSAGQLEKEMTDGAWLVGDANEDIIFESEPENVWKKAISNLGENYSLLANMPLDPQLN